MAVASSTPRNDVLYRALLAGFVGTALAGFVLLLAYGFSGWLGATIPGILGQWFYKLTSNQATTLVQDALARALLLHICVGLIWALVYAYWAEPRLSGPGWLRGCQFALVPWVLSLVVFLPLVGGGFLGLALGAGPLPIIGNFILHMFYGGTLGELYELEVAEGVHVAGHPESVTTLTNVSAERGLAAGLVAGGIVGVVLGTIVAALIGTGTVPLAVGALSGAVFGAAGGALVGSFVGLARA